jgi:hypothetical protein
MPQPGDGFFAMKGQDDGGRASARDVEGVCVVFSDNRDDATVPDGLFRQPRGLQYEVRLGIGHTPQTFNFRNVDHVFKPR